MGQVAQIYRGRASREARERGMFLAQRTTCKFPARGYKLLFRVSCLLYSLNAIGQRLGRLGLLPIGSMISQAKHGTTKTRERECGARHSLFGEKSKSSISIGSEQKHAARCVSRTPQP